VARPGGNYLAMEESIENPIQTDGYVRSALPLRIFKNTI
jgi:hypothetical protein